MSKNWPGYLLEPGTTYPFNILPADAMNIALVDGRTADDDDTPYNGLALTRLRNEIYTGTAQAVNPDPDEGLSVAAISSRPELLFSRGMIAHYDATVSPWRHPKYGPWHRLESHAGLSAVDISSPATMVLASNPLLIDDDVAVEALDYGSVGNCAVGVTVGTLAEDGAAFAPVAGGLAVFSDNTTHLPDSVASGQPYGSNDGVNWTLIPLASMNGGGYSGGKGTFDDGVPLGGQGKIYLFAADQTYVHYAVVYRNNSTTTTFVTEMIALARFGDCSISDDFINYQGIKPADVPGPASLVSGAVSQVKFVFSGDTAIADCRWRVRPILFCAVGDDASAGVIGMAHMELYSDPAYSNFATGLGAALNRIQVYTSAGEAGNFVPFAVTNLHPTLKAVVVDLTVPNAPVTVADEPLANTGNTTGNLPHAIRNVTRVGRTLNAALDGDGSVGDTSLSFGGDMSGWTVIDFTGTPAGDEIAVNFGTGEYKTGNAVPANGTWSGSYYSLGCQTTDLAETESSPVEGGATLTLTSGEVAPNGGMAHFKARADFSARPVTEARRNRMTVIAKMRFSSGIVES